MEQSSIWKEFLETTRNAKNEELLTENKNLENEINSIKKKLNSKRTSDDKKVQLKNK